MKSLWRVNVRVAAMAVIALLILSSSAYAASAKNGTNAQLPKFTDTSVCNFNGAYSGSKGFLYINNTGQCMVNYMPTSFSQSCNSTLWGASSVGSTYTCPDPSDSFMSTGPGGGGGGGSGSPEYVFTLIYHNTVSVINATSSNPDNENVLPLNNLFTLAGSPGYYYVSYLEDSPSSCSSCSHNYTAQFQNLTVALSASSSTVKAGPSSGYVGFTNSTTGGYPYGSPPYTYNGYTVYLSGQQIQQSSGDYLQQGNAFTFYVKGNYTVKLGVTDKNGDTAYGSATVYVNSSHLPTGCLSSDTASQGTCIFTTYETITTDYPDAGSGSFTSSLGSISETPVTLSVLQKNSNQAGYLLTCPDSPDQGTTLSNGAIIYDTYEYFTSDNASFIGGDRCLASSGSLTTTATLTVNTAWNGTSYATSNDILQLSNVARGKVQNLGYSGESIVQGYTHYNISSNYDTQSYIFNTTPAVTQRGLWTWHSEYADLNSSNSNLGSIENGPTTIYDRYFQTTNSNGRTCRYYYNYTVEAYVNYLNTSRIILPDQIGNTNSKNYVINNGQTSSPYAQSTNTNTSWIVKIPFDCHNVLGYRICLYYPRYTCAYQLWSDTNQSVLLSSDSGTTVQCANGHDYELIGSKSATVYYDGNTEPDNNIYINVTPGAKSDNYWVSYEVCSGWECDNPNYYMGYAFKAIGYTNTTILPYFLYNITMPTTASNLNNKIGFLNLSYDMYSPHNYLSPNAYLEPFPTSTGSAFFATINGKFGEYPLNVTSISNPNTEGLSGQPTIHFIDVTPASDLPSDIASSAGTLGQTLGNLGLYSQLTVGSPGFISASPNDYIYIINYSNGCTGFLCTIPTTTANLYILRFVPVGNFNVSNLQPDIVPFSTNLSDSYQTTPFNSSSNVQSAKTNWINEWKTYWNNTLTEQSANLYIIGDSTLTHVKKGIFGITGGFFGWGKAVGTGTFNFVPSAITSDYANDVFLEGRKTDGNNLVLGYLLANGTSNETVLNNFQQMVSSEFAVSPGGQYLYLANPNEGNITIFRSLNFTFVGNMSLAYTNSTDSLNITKYLVDGGPYHSQRIANFYAGLIQNANTIDSTANHHPIAISESDGVLYVLDNWTFDVAGYNSTILMLSAFTANDTEVPIDPSHIPDIYSLNPNSISTSTGYDVNASYPPYGWPISANISIGNSNYITYCIANCTYTPNTIPSSKSNGYLPIGPEINIFADSYGEQLTSIYFSSNFNNTGYLLAHVGGFNFDYTGINGAYTELLTMDMDISNYTSPSLLSNMSFSCYLNTTHASANPCIDAPHDSSVGNTLKDMSGPLLGVPSSFKYAENLGSPYKYIVLSNLVGSAFPTAGASNSTSSASGNSIQGNSTLANEIVSNEVSPITMPSSSALSVPQTYLKSSISGYFLIPFNESYTLVQTWSPYPTPGILISGSGSCPDYTTYNGTSTGNNNVTYVQTNVTYGYAQASVLPSPVNETIEGGPTYIKYVSQANKYYIPNVSDANAIMPPYLNFEIFTNRLFGEVYINQSVSPQLNYQMSNPLVVNQTHTINYVIDAYGQSMGSATYPAYYTEEAMPLSTEQTSVDSGSAYYNPSRAFSYPSLISSSNSLINGSDSTFVQLYQIYHRESIEDALLLSLQNDSHILGYNRLVYTFVDQFNNTIYAPLDVDLANMTSITLDPKTVVSPTDANETTINVTGVAGYYPSIFSYLPSPLPTGSTIYIYYDTNINFYNASYSSSSQKAYAEYQQTCAFSPNSICILANPANASQTASAPNGNSFLAYSSFNTQYNSSGECSPEPKSLLNVTNYNCNIYGDYSLPETGTTASGDMEYCLPQFDNGTGTLTSQLGYVGTASTNSTGYFSRKFQVCGTGTAKVIATYYGTPLPQPNVYHQSSLGRSADYSLPSSGYQPYSEYTYTYAPNQTASSFEIGSYALGFGNVELPLAFALIGLILALMYKYKRP